MFFGFINFAIDSQTREYSKKPLADQPVKLSKSQIFSKQLPRDSSGP